MPPTFCTIFSASKDGQCNCGMNAGASVCHNLGANFFHVSSNGVRESGNCCHFQVYLNRGVLPLGRRTIFCFCFGIGTGPGTHKPCVLVFFNTGSPHCCVFARGASMLLPNFEISRCMSKRSEALSGQTKMWGRRGKSSSRPVQ